MKRKITENELQVAWRLQLDTKYHVGRLMHQLAATDGNYFNIHPDYMPQAQKLVKQSEALLIEAWTCYLRDNEFACEIPDYMIPPTPDK